MNFGIFDPILNPVVGSLSATFLKIVMAIVIAMLAFIIGKISSRVVFKLLSEIELNKFIKNNSGVRINLDQLVSNFIAYAIYFLGIVAALEQIGIANIILYLLSGALILIIILSFFLAARDFIPNFMAGIYMYGKGHDYENKNIETLNLKGRVVQIDLLQTRIETKNGDIITIPNSVFINAQVKIKKR